MSDLGIRSRVTIILRNNITADFISFNGLKDGKEHLALLFTAKAADKKIPLVRLHSECLTGDVFGSMRCDCGAQLDEAIAKISSEGGIILYMRQEGRGIGLYNKLDAYKLQIEQGLDTFEANIHLNLPADAREYDTAAAMLKAVGVDTIRLLTNNPDKAEKLKAAGIKVAEIIPTSTFTTPENRKYICTKIVKTGHTLNPG